MPSVYGHPYDPPMVKQLNREHRLRVAKADAKKPSSGASGRRGDLQDWGSRQFIGAPTKLTLYEHKAYGSTFERATDFSGVTKPPFVHLAVDVLGGVVGNALSPADYRPVGIAVGVLAANWLYNRPMRIQVPLPNPATTGALEALVFGSSTAADYPKGWTPGQRPGAKYRLTPDEQAEADKVARAGGATVEEAGGDADESFGARFVRAVGDVAEEADEAYGPEAAARIIPAELDV